MIVEELDGITCEVDWLSNCVIEVSPDNQNLAMVAVFQSGETVDTLAVMRRYKENNALTIGVVNVTSSSIAREFDNKSTHFLGDSSCASCNISGTGKRIFIRRY